MKHKLKKTVSLTLASALIVASGASAFAAKDSNPGKSGSGNGKPISQISSEKPVKSKKPEKPEKSEVGKRPDHVAQKLENKAEWRESLLQKRAELKKKYSEAEVEALEEAAEEIDSENDDIMVLPFDSVVSRRHIKFDTPPVIKSGRTLIPVRAISEGFKATVDWNEDAQEVTIEKDGTTIVIAIGSNTVTVNGEPQEIDSEAQIMSRRTYVPLRFIAETLGLRVDWEEETETIDIDEDLEDLKEDLEDELEDLKEKLAELQEEDDSDDDSDTEDGSNDTESEEDSSDIDAIAQRIAEIEAELQSIDQEIAESSDDDELDSEDDSDDSDETTDVDDSSSVDSDVSDDGDSDATVEGDDSSNSDDLSEESI